MKLNMRPFFFGLLLALSMDVRNILVYGDSQLIVHQVNNIYEVRKPELVPYHTAAQILMKKFEHIQLLHVPRSKNASADALAKLAAALVLPQGEEYCFHPLPFVDIDIHTSQNYIFYTSVLFKKKSSST